LGNLLANGFLKSYLMYWGLCFKTNQNTC